MDCEFRLVPIPFSINPHNRYIRHSAKAAAGKVEGSWLFIRALSEDEACQVFTEGYMGGRVVALPRRTW